MKQNNRKTCLKEGCSNPRFSKGYCSWHVPKKAPKPKTPAKQIKTSSDKQLIAKGKYMLLREVFLNIPKNMLCAARLDGCTKRSTDVHHGAGRVGAHFLDMDTWIGLCRSCHIWVETHPREAKERGLSFSRLKKPKNNGTEKDNNNEKSS